MKRVQQDVDMDGQLIGAFERNVGGDDPERGHHVHQRPEPDDRKEQPEPCCQHR
jgi:hypothetical protein